jgi:hypothetical protein
VLGDQRPRPRRVQGKLELGHHAEVAAPAAQRPVQVRMLGAAGRHQPPVGGHHLAGDDVVAGQAVLAGEPAHAAAEGQPADAGV